MKFEEFAELVREKRAEAGLSQVELGRRIQNGSDAKVQKTISNLETGIGCTDEVASAVCRVLKIKPVKVDKPDGNRFRVRISDWLNPSLNKEDIATLCGNEVLRKVVDRKTAELIRQECEKFRKALKLIK